MPFAECFRVAGKVACSSAMIVGTAGRHVAIGEYATPFYDLQSVICFWSE